MFNPFIEQTLLLVLVLSAVPLLLSSFAALLVSILQTATQVQEQSLSFLVKFSVLSLLCFLFGQDAFAALLRLLETFLGSLNVLGRLA